MGVFLPLPASGPLIILNAHFRTHPVVFYLMDVFHVVYAAPPRPEMSTNDLVNHIPATLIQSHLLQGCGRKCAFNILNGSEAGLEGRGNHNSTIPEISTDHQKPMPIIQVNTKRHTMTSMTFQPHNPLPVWMEQVPFNNLETSSFTRTSARLMEGVWKRSKVTQRGIHVKKFGCCQEEPGRIMRVTSATGS